MTPRHLITLALLCMSAPGIDGKLNKSKRKGKEGNVTIEKCCQEKTVGDISYKLISTGNTTAFGCVDSCIYEAIQNPGSRVCFETGDLPVNCIKENGCKCGIKGTKQGREARKTKNKERQEAGVNEYPWITYILSSFDNGHTEACGGSLIASEWVLTAAHCLVKNDTKKAKDVFAVLIAHNVEAENNPLEQRKFINITEMIPHPYYHEFIPNENDIALLRLSEPVDLDIYTPVCLPDMGADFTGMSGWLAGWGSNSSASNVDIPKWEFTSPGRLMVKEVKIVGREECFSHWMNQNISRIITSGMVCANSTKPSGMENAAQCADVSGGPLTVEMDGKYILVGDVSFGPRPCEQEGTIGVYGNVAFFRDWIDFTMNKDDKPSFCSE